jgi:MFS family permease
LRRSRRSGCPRGKPLQRTATGGSACSAHHIAAFRTVDPNFAAVVPVYQLKSFDASQPDSVISAQPGWITAGFTAAQFCTAFAWGRAADSEIFGRKVVILLGLLGTMISVVGFGFRVVSLDFSPAYLNGISVLLTENLGTCIIHLFKTHRTDLFTWALESILSRKQKRETKVSN